MRDTPRLIAQHGGEEWKWEKKSGIIKIPKGSKLEKVRVIAGKGTQSILRDTPRLIAQHGGEEWKWEKKSGIIKTDNFTYESHWYEYEGKQYENKLKRKGK